MTTNNSILERDYRINSQLINTNKKLGLFGLLGLLQDMAGEHSEKLGFGYEDCKQKGFFWVLVRQKLTMNRWADWNDVVTIKTWAKPMQGINVIREYELFIGEEKIGDCSTTWIILDSVSRRPKKIGNSDILFAARSDYSLDYSAPKITVEGELTAINTFDVRISDLDMNRHVNNAKYTQWILDTIPYEYHDKYTIKAYEMNFLAETFLDDRVTVTSNLQQLNVGDSYEIYFKGYGTDEKPVFIAKMITQEIT